MIASIFMKLFRNPPEAKDETAQNGSDVEGAPGGFTISIGMGAGASVDKKCKRGHFYVYVHKEENGRVFYVGKGTERRAWSKDHDEQWCEHVARLGGKYIVEVVRDGISEEDALEIEDAVMAQHGDTILNQQNMHAPWDSEKYKAHDDAMKTYDLALQDATKLAIANRHEAACVRFEDAYAAWNEAQRHGDFVGGARTYEGSYPPIELTDVYTKYLRRSEQRDRIVTFAEQVGRDYPDSKTRPAMRILLECAARVKAGKKVSSGRAVATFSPPAALPPDWERVKEGRLLTIRLKRSLRLSKGSHYTDTVEPLKQLRRERRYAEALALMKAAIVDLEVRSAREHLPPPPFYFEEAAKACRDLGDFLQECLVLQRQLDLIRRCGRDDLGLYTRLGVAAAKIESTRLS